MIFDAHFHIINPDFPLIPNNDYLPDHFTIENYKQQTKDLGVFGGAVVSGSFQGIDQTYLISALNQLSPTFVGVTQLATSASDQEILDLDKVGVRAIRFNLFRGGSEDIKHLEALAKRVYDLAKWHVELYIDSQTLDQHVDVLLRLPKYGIDHLGISSAGLPQLYKAVEQGAHVKATGFMRVDFDVAPVLKKINEINPKALMFGTDLPGTRASRQFSIEDLQMIVKSFDKEAAERILWSNAAEYYGVSAGLD